MPWELIARNRPPGANGHERLPRNAMLETVCWRGRGKLSADSIGATQVAISLVLWIPKANATSVHGAPSRPGEHLEVPLLRAAAFGWDKAAENLARRAVKV